VIRNYVASQGVVTISTRLWLQIQPEWCGDFEPYHGSPWVDEGATVTFATKFHWLSKPETADNMMSFSVKVNSRKGKNRSKRIGFDIFA